MLNNQRIYQLKLYSTFRTDSTVESKHARGGILRRINVWRRSCYYKRRLLRRSPSQVAGELGGGGGGGLQADVISVRPTRDITSGYKDASAIERLDWTAISLHRVPVTVGKIGGDSM